MSDALYRKLGLTPQASMAEIKAAYRRLAFTYHPDRHGGSPAATQRFRELVAAYKALSKSAPVLPVVGEDEFVPLAVSRPNLAAVPRLDLGLLGMFLGLALAGVSAVPWRSQRVPWSRRGTKAR